jgi:hypothetical protein
MGAGLGGSRPGERPQPAGGKAWRERRPGGEPGGLAGKGSLAAHAGEKACWPSRGRRSQPSREDPAWEDCGGPAGTGSTGLAGAGSISPAGALAKSGPVT